MLKISVQSKRHKNQSFTGASELRLFLIFGRIDYRQRYTRPYTMNRAEVSILTIGSKQASQYSLINQHGIAI